MILPITSLSLTRLLSPSISLSVEATGLRGLSFRLTRRGGPLAGRGCCPEGEESEGAAAPAGTRPHEVRLDDRGRQQGPRPQHSLQGQVEGRDPVLLRPEAGRRVRRLGSRPCI